MVPTDGESRTQVRWWLVEPSDLLRCFDLFPLLRQVAVEPLFRKACLALLLTVALLAIGIAPAWVATPRGFYPTIRISGLDALQSHQFEAAAKAAWAGGDVDTALHCWKQAIANHPGRGSLLRWGLLQAAAYPDRRDPRLEAVVAPAFWLLRLGRTNALDVDLVVRALAGVRDVEWLSRWMKTLPGTRTPIQRAVLLCETFQEHGFPAIEPDWPPATGLAALDERLEWVRAQWIALRNPGGRYRTDRLAQGADPRAPLSREFVHAVTFWGAHLRKDLWAMETALEHLQRERHDLPSMHVAYWAALRDCGRMSEARAAAAGYVALRMRPEEVIQVVSAQMRLGLEREALACLKAQVLQTGSGSDLWLFYTGELRRCAQWEELRLAALQLRDTASRTPALRSYGHFLEGVCWHREGQRLRASNALERAVHADTSPASLAQAMAVQLMDLGYATHAHEWLSQLEPSLGSDADYWGHRLRAAVACGDWVGVLNASRQRFRRVPNDATAARHLVSALLMLSPLDPALTELARQSLAMAPRHSEAQLNCVRVQLARGRVNEALARFALIGEDTGDSELEALRTAVGFELACAREDDRAALAHWAALDQGILPGPYLERLLPLHRQRALRASP